MVGSGVSGLSAGWLLSRRHAVTLFEAGPKIGGHSNTIDWEGTPVDTGFIVYNEPTYPNLTALFRHLDVPTMASNMSFAASLDDGRLEYSGSDLFGLFAQRRNLVRPRFWAMLREILRFFRQAPRDLGSIGGATLDEYLDCCAATVRRCARISSIRWPRRSGRRRRRKSASIPPSRSFAFSTITGCCGLSGQPIWRTVAGGSRVYVERLLRGDFRRGPRRPARFGRCDGATTASR